MTPARKKKSEEEEEGGDEYVDISDLKEGVKVLYHPVGTAMQTSVGLIKEVFDHDEITGNTHKRIHATPKEPRILIENLHTHKETAYKLENIVRIVDDEE